MCGWIHRHTSGNWSNALWRDDLVQEWELAYLRGWGCENSGKRNGATVKSLQACQSLPGNVGGVGVSGQGCSGEQGSLESCHLWVPLLPGVVSRVYGREFGTLLISTASRHGKGWVRAGTNEDKLASINTFQMISTFHYWHLWRDFTYFYSCPDNMEKGILGNVVPNQLAPWNWALRTYIGWWKTEEKEVRIGQLELGSSHFGPHHQII